MRRIDPYTKRAMTYEEFMARPPERNPGESREEGRNAHQRWKGRNARQAEWTRARIVEGIDIIMCVCVCVCVCVCMCVCVLMLCFSVFSTRGHLRREY